MIACNCGLTGGCSYCKPVEYDKITFIPPVEQGWICPVCFCGIAPRQDRCGCNLKTVTLPGTES